MAVESGASGEAWSELTKGQEREEKKAREITSLDRERERTRRGGGGGGEVE